MNQHQHKHHDHDHQHKKPKGLHTDWRLWLVVVLMLAAMVIYVLSDDESIQPGQPNASPPVPAAP